MRRDRWDDEFLNRMRTVGDAKGDSIAAAILSPTSRDHVNGHLDRLLEKQRDLRAHPPERPERAQRELRAEVKETEFCAGTFSVLECLKVTERAMRSAAMAFGYDDPGAATRFQDLAIAALESAKQGVEEAQDDEWYSKERKRLAYNHLLEISEYLAMAPELLSSPQSNVARKFSAYPSGFQEYFAPVPAPAWVDEEKLERASQIWDDNMLFILLILFSGSLPFCYLDDKGIPLLYQTGKLREKKYLSQRLYETGLMLDSVMSRGGITVFHDTADQRRLFAEAVNGIDPALEFRYDPRGHAQWNASRQMPETEVIEAKMAELQDRDRERLQAAGREVGEPGGRFLAGKGVLYAKKVRLLHASMRFMALKVPESHPAGVDASGNKRWQVDKGLAGVTWDSEKDGVPINQEDLAYTLLTFGYVIPTGLESWGRRPDKEGIEAFLHCWKVTGYLMGIEGDLLTDDLDEAEYLFNKMISRFNVDADPAGNPTAVVMTTAVAGFLSDYLPNWFDLKKGLPAVMIEDQVGAANAEVLLGDRVRPSIFTKLFYWLLTFCSRTHSLMNRMIYRRSRLLRAFLGDLMHEVGVAFFESWRGPFERKPYFIPANLQDWKPEPGISEKYMERLHKWRERVFVLLALGLITLIAGSVVVVGGIVGSIIVDGRDPFEVSLLISLPLFVLSVVLMRHIVNKSIHNRPKLESGGKSV